MTGRLSGSFIIGTLTAATFGPYIQLSGLRTEQIAVYGLLAAALCCWAGTKLHISSAGKLIATLLLAQILVGLMSIVDPAPNPTHLPSGSFLAGLDNLCLPLAALWLTWMVIAYETDREALLRTACSVLVVAMCVNALVALISMKTGLSPHLEMFWQHDDTVVSIAEKAADLGRYTGILNQPAEAGALYAIALLATIYRYSDRLPIFAVTAGLLTIGGVLTVSKIFLLLGLPIAAWQILRNASVRRSLTAITAIVILIVAARLTGAGPLWQGESYLARLFAVSQDTDFVGLYTAGRFGSSSSVTEVASAVLGKSPWLGVGPSGLRVAYDNGWIEALVVGGVVGVATYTAVLGALAIAWFARRRMVTPAQSAFSGSLVLLLVGGSVGLPMLTANRVATIVWMLLGLLVLWPAGQPAAGSLVPVQFRVTQPNRQDQPASSSS